MRHVSIRIIIFVGFIIVSLYSCKTYKFCYNQKDCLNKTGIIFSVDNNANSDSIYIKFTNTLDRVVRLNDTLRLYCFEDNFFEYDTLLNNKSIVKIGYTNSKLIYEHFFKTQLVIQPNSFFTWSINKKVIIEKTKDYPAQDFQIFYRSNFWNKSNIRVYYGMLASNYFRI